MNNLFSYEGKRVVVVGCYSGMGAATAKVVASLGAEVHGIDIRQPDYTLNRFTLCDLRDRRQIDPLLDSITEPVDGLFYCAGLPQTFAAVDVMTVNFAAMRHVVDGLLPRIPSGGAVAIISSNGGLQFAQRMDLICELLATESFEGARQWCSSHVGRYGDAYLFSKEAMIVYMMRRALASVPDGVRVNCLCPGPTETPMTDEFAKAAGLDAMRPFWGPMKRQATADEMGWPMAFLNSEAASFITGLNFVVDGGFLASVLTGELDIAALLTAGTDAIAERNS